MSIKPTMFLNFVLVSLQFMPAQIEEVVSDQMSSPQPDATP